MYELIQKQVLHPVVFHSHPFNPAIHPVIDYSPRNSVSSLTKKEQGKMY